MERRKWLRRTQSERKPLKRTGPSLWVRHLVYRRAEHRCEFSECGLPGTCIHHRYERKAGGVGSKSPAIEWINTPVNLLVACTYHNDWCSNQQPLEAWRIGWLWRSGDAPAADVPVTTFHDPLPVYLNMDGTWTRFEEREDVV